MIAVALYHGTSQVRAALVAGEEMLWCPHVITDPRGAALYGSRREPFTQQKVVVYELPDDLFEWASHEDDEAHERTPLGPGIAYHIKEDVPLEHVIRTTTWSVQFAAVSEWNRVWAASPWGAKQDDKPSRLQRWLGRTAHPLVELGDKPVEHDVKDVQREIDAMRKLNASRCSYERMVV